MLAARRLELHVVLGGRPLEPALVLGGERLLGRLRLREGARAHRLTLLDVRLKLEPERLERRLVRLLAELALRTERRQLLALALELLLQRLKRLLELLRLALELARLALELLVLRLELLRLALERLRLGLELLVLRLELLRLALKRLRLALELLVLRLELLLLRLERLGLGLQLAGDALELCRLGLELLCIHPRRGGARRLHGERLAAARCLGGDRLGEGGGEGLLLVDGLGRLLLRRLLDRRHHRLLLVYGLDRLLLRRLLCGRFEHDGLDCLGAAERGLPRGGALPRELQAQRIRLLRRLLLRDRRARRAHRRLLLLLGVRAGDPACERLRALDACLALGVEGGLGLGSEGHLLRLEGRRLDRRRARRRLPHLGLLARERLCALRLHPPRVRRELRRARGGRLLLLWGRRSGGRRHRRRLRRLRRRSNLRRRILLRAVARGLFHRRKFHRRRDRVRWDRTAAGAPLDGFAGGGHLIARHARLAARHAALPTLTALLAEGRVPVDPRGRGGEPLPARHPAADLAASAGNVRRLAIGGGGALGNPEALRPAPTRLQRACRSPLAPNRREARKEMREQERRHVLVGPVPPEHVGGDENRGHGAEGGERAEEGLHALRGRRALRLHQPRRQQRRQVVVQQRAQRAAVAQAVAQVAQGHAVGAGDRVDPLKEGHARERRLQPAGVRDRSRGRRALAKHRGVARETGDGNLRRELPEHAGERVHAAVDDGLLGGLELLRAHHPEHLHLGERHPDVVQLLHSRGARQAADGAAQLRRRRALLRPHGGGALEEAAEAGAVAHVARQRAHPVLVLVARRLLMRERRTKSGEQFGQVARRRREAELAELGGHLLARLDLRGGDEETQRQQRPTLRRVQKHDQRQHTLDDRCVRRREGRLLVGALRLVVVATRGGRGLEGGRGEEVLV